MPIRRSARDVAALFAALSFALVLACAPDHVIAPNENGSMVLEDGDELDTALAAPTSRRISVVLRDRKGAPIPALRVDWQALDHGAIKPAFSITNEWDPLESTCRHASLSIL